MKTITLTLLLVVCSFPAFAQGGDCVSLCCVCPGKGKNPQCQWGALSGHCSCVNTSGHSCSTTGTCGMFLCFTGSPVKGGAPVLGACTNADGVRLGQLAPDELKLVTDQQTAQSWVKSGDLANNIEPHSAFVAEFMRDQQQSTARGKIAHAKQYQGTYSLRLNDDNSPWTRYEAEWGPSGITYHFHNEGVKGPDALTITSNGAWFLTQGQAQIANGLYTK